MLFAEGKLGDRKTEQKGTFITQGDVADHLDQATLKSLAKAQRPVLSQLEEEERKPSLATDEKVQSILERPVWSLQHMRQKVKLLPLPDPSYLKHQEWMWDDNKPIPKSSVREAPMRDWRSSFFEQIKCDSKLRIEMKNLREQIRPLRYTHLT